LKNSKQRDDVFKRYFKIVYCSLIHYAFPFDSSLINERMKMTNYKFENPAIDT